LDKTNISKKAFNTGKIVLYILPLPAFWLMYTGLGLLTAQGLGRLTWKPAE